MRDVVRQPEEKRVADELREEQTERELQDPLQFETNVKFWSKDWCSQLVGFSTDI